MSLSDDLKKKADDYVFGSMSKQLRSEFKKRIDSDSELAAYIKVNEEMKSQYNDEDWFFIDRKHSDIDNLESFLKNSKIQELKKTIQTINHKHFENKSKSKKKNRYYYLLAACLVSLLGYFVFNTSQSTLDVYTEYSDWSTLPSLTSRGESNRDLLHSAEVAFLEQDYEKTKKMLEKYSDLNSIIDPNASLYLGISYLETNDFDSAIGTFDKLIQSNSLDSSKGFWYKALVYLKAGDKKGAKNILKLIVKSPSNYNYEKARDILKDID
ncbi:tetratricopeptide repeat protein [Hanstruepera ponticola]|uniref:tetratricopeptide repeat protein n=1 Tax=Hanstruepera ponticola TaxID=2042995 RepID=UPI000CF12B1C|nr:tetratricopeptide repeat protein [Hanstruepera ponticola]